MVTTQTPAIDKAMAVFAFLADNGRASFTQIQKATGLPKSTSSSLLASLLAHGLVSLEEGRYALGLRWYELGNKVEEGLDIKRAAISFHASRRAGSPWIPLDGCRLNRRPS